MGLAACSTALRRMPKAITVSPDTENLSPRECKSTTLSVQFPLRPCAAQLFYVLCVCVCAGEVKRAPTQPLRAEKQENTQSLTSLSACSRAAAASLSRFKPFALSSAHMHTYASHPQHSLDPLSHAFASSMACSASRSLPPSRAHLTRPKPSQAIDHGPGVTPGGPRA